VGLWCVADGMGGHARGDAASRAVVEALSAVPRGDDPRDFLSAVLTALDGVHDRLVETSARDGLSGSTVVALLVVDGHYAVAWAGDSRLYLLREARLTQVTTDHSVVQELVEAGKLSAEEARTHPMRNRITSAIGAGAHYKRGLAGDRLVGGDRFLLCTDGLSEPVAEVEIAAVLGASAPEEACRRLVELALAAGGPDNVTAVVVEVLDTGAAGDGRRWP
jgi:serine/threonine protein phosphatase PrpC